MPVTYDKERKQWVARYTLNGKRVFVGRYKTEKLAHEAIVAAHKRVESLNSVSLDNAGQYEPELVQIDENLVQRAINRFRKRRAERLKDKQVRTQLEEL